MKLFDDDSGPEEHDIANIEINQDYARRLQHNKERDDLMRLKELQKRGLAGDDDDDDESSSDESEPDVDIQFVEALHKIKNQDPILKQKDAKLFDDNKTEKEKKVPKGEKGKKPMYLKDVTAKHLLEDGPEFDDEVDVKSYAQEQDELRRGLVKKTQKAMEEVEGDGDLFKVKEVEGEAEEEDDEVVEVGKKLEAYFGKDDNLNENEVFLKKYLTNRMWVGEDEGRKVVDEEGLELSDDEVAIEKQEDYERGFNFRFEENAGDRVLGHSRVVEGSVRKKTNSRKAQRISKEEREAEKEKERKEEVKRLKNLKKKEIGEKIKKLKREAGIEGDWDYPLDEDYLEDDYDPEEHNSKMKEVFPNEYYAADDVNPVFGCDEDEDGDLEKPDFDKEDELLGLEKGWVEMSGSGDGFLAAREKALKRKPEIEGHLKQIIEVGEEEEDQEEEEEDQEDVGREEEGVKQGKRKKKRKMSKLAKEIMDKELEEYYKLDYEDTIGDLKTRFKYRDVSSSRYGLSAKEILMLDDTDLNQYVPTKKLAPYGDEWKVDKRKTLALKEKLRSRLKGESVDEKKNDEKKSKAEDHKSDDEEIKGGTGELSKKQRRKLRKKESQLPENRRVAYGEIPTKSKSKKN